MRLSDKLRTTEQEAPEPDTGAADDAGDGERSPGSQRGGGRGRERRTVPSQESGSDAADDGWVAAKREVRELVLNDLSPKLTGPDAPDDADLEEEVTSSLDEILEREDVSVSPAARRRFVAELLDDILGYGPLETLLDDPDITEIMCNAHDEIWIERDGSVEPTHVQFVDEDQYRQIIDRIVSEVGRRVDEASPMVDARLPDGSRVNVIVPPLALAAPVMTIRRFPEDPLTVPDLVTLGTLPQKLGVLLEACVRGKLNVLVSGGTASGKTTLLNAMSSFIPDGDRIITIEDAAELQLQQPHVVGLESRPANTEGSGQVTIRDLVRNSLRMRPDRIVVGEVRGAEALDMLQAMNTGHEGSLTTIHANGPRDALSRLETLVLMAELDLPERAIREQIAGALDVVVHLERLPDGQRKLMSMQEVQGLEGSTILLQEIYSYEPQIGEDGRYIGTAAPTGLRPRFLEELEARDVDVPAAVFREGPPEGVDRRGGGR